MSDDFDPYYQWLGVSPKYQPPTHYRLLGLELFESNRDVISTAADQRMAHVRSFQSGPRGALSQKILNELSAARLCLLNPQAKRDYDAELRARLATERAAASADASPPAGERWAQNLAADVKAASRFAASQAERLKIVQFKLPEAYRDLGADAYAQHRFDDEFPHLYPEIRLAEDEVKNLQAAQQSWGQLTAKIKNRAQLEAAERHLHGTLRELGQLAYAEFAAASGPPALIATIESLDRRVSELDAELQSLEQSRSGRLIGPKWLALAGLAIVLIVLLSIAGHLLQPLVLVLALAVTGYFGYRYFIKK
jgi:hypothetical protein